MVFLDATAGETTAAIDHDASATQFEAALERLSTIGDVEVSLIAPNSFDGRTWLVSFVANGGDLNMLDADDALLLPAAGTYNREHNVSSGALGASVQVSEWRPGAAIALGGTFTLSYGAM